MNFIKILSIRTIFFITLFLSSVAIAYDGTLVLDVRNTPALPSNFRTSSDTLPGTINKTGLSDLRIAGSGQFSKLGLERVLERLRTKRVTIIDLREESHGFLNGNGISWYIQGNAINAGMTPSQIENTQNQLLDELNNEVIAKTYLILRKGPTERIEKTKLVEFSVHAVSSEEVLANNLNLAYNRFYVQDHNPPNIKQIDRFVRAVKELPKDQWVYFHCRAGMGRTTTFMAMYDMLHNAKQVSFEDIIARQAALGGRDLTALPEPGTYKYKSSMQRLAFLKEFYEYAKENRDGFRTSFREWQRKR